MATLEENVQGHEVRLHLLQDIAERQQTSIERLDKIAERQQTLLEHVDQQIEEIRLDAQKTHRIWVYFARKFGWPEDGPEEWSPPEDVE